MLNGDVVDGAFMQVAIPGWCNCVMLTNEWAIGCYHCYNPDPVNSPARTRSPYPWARYS
jgi:hypothetical protein